MADLKFQRDVFIDEVRVAAKRDRDIVFISADFGAPALDAFRSEQASQFLHAGISEQNMIDLAAGLALAGKKVYVYAMAPFITLRCIEQIKCSLAIMNLPVTVLAVGVGLSYADSGPTHYTTEDLACMRSLAGAEVLTAADSETARAIARLTIDKPAFRIVRLDRNALPTVYSTNAPESLARGFHVFGGETGTAIATCGFMLHRALRVRQALAKEGVDVAVIDVTRIKPLPGPLAAVLSRYSSIITVEEQCLAGGFGSAMIELLNDAGLPRAVRRLGLPEKYVFENGGRNHLLDMLGLSDAAIADAVSRPAAKTG